MLLSCPETRQLRKEFLIKKWFDMDEKVPVKEMLSSNYKASVVDLSSYLDNLKYGSGLIG